MESYRIEWSDEGKARVRVPYRGSMLLHHPLFNKGTAFTQDERRRFGLEGLLPQHVASIEEQVDRVYGNMERKADPLERFIGLASLHDRNEVLFYRLVLEHIEEFLPIVYTPTVGLACQKFSRIFRRGRGLWITPEDRGRIKEVLANAPYQDVRLIVVTDNERILGLGDQGAGGMGIPVGKLALYTIAAGIHPSQCLPISLDVGTDNKLLLQDPLYLGYHAPRMRGQPYYDLVEEFVEAVSERFPTALLQWEDFKKANAFTLLDRYRDRVLSFNDDIQGTAAVALAGVLAANRVTNTHMRDHRVVILGAGAAGIGIARQLRDAMKRDGLSGEALSSAIALIDSSGLLVNDREINEVHKAEFAWPRERAARLDLDDSSLGDLAHVISAMKATILIGTSGQPGVFDERVVRAMAACSKRPAILPFSNPTDYCEGKPADILAWSEGRALVATGSPFAPVEINGRKIKIGQGNNVYIFPGVGLGALVAGATQVTDSMFTAAAQALADHVSAADLESGSLYPPLSELREISAEIAAAVVREARDSGLCPEVNDAVIPTRVAQAMWYPEYPEFIG